MKVIDAMIKISRGEKVKFEILNDENHIYSSTNGSYLYDETSEEDVYWFIDEDWLNIEIKLIEENKIIEKLDKYADVSRDIVCKWRPAEKKLKDKINEIIDYIMEDKHD